MLLCIGLCMRSLAQQARPAPVNSPQSDQNVPQSPSGDQPQTPAPPPQTEEPPQTEAQPQTSTPPQPETQQQSPAPKKATPAAKKRKPVKRHTASTESGKVVVRNGGAKDNSGQLTPALSPEQELHSRENTTELLATTDSNLKKVADRQLSAAQRSMLDQIHAYVRQAKAASDSGDVTRAHTLAYKAHLLSDELAGK
jgi:outer membrane biosynthesis protein TonB